METDTEQFMLTIVCGMQRRIDPTPVYQRTAVWKKPQKQLLMDTILRKYDVPKFYWRKVERDNGIEFEVIDGQQRLLAIWEFCRDGYRLAKDAESINGENVANCLFSELPYKLFQEFNQYKLDVVVITGNQDDKFDADIRDMFRRLQNGTTLNPQEKRNSFTGNMSDAVKEIAKHPFLESCAFKNTRGAFDLIVAQTILLELKGGATNIRSADINKMYKTYTQFDDEVKTIQKVKKVYDFLLKAFPETNPHLKHFNVVNLYCLVSILIKDYVSEGLEKSLADWFIKFEMERQENDEKEKDKRDVLLVDYSRFIKSSGDTGKNINFRLEMLKKRFFSKYPDIKTRDPVRSFNEEQRLAIYWRDKGRCQLRLKCDGKEELGWNNWQADHKIPHSKGGKTIVSNGVVACTECNQSKGNKSSE